MVTEAGTSKLGGNPGLYSKPLGCGASEVYASGPACKEEEVRDFIWGYMDLTECAGLL